MKCHCGTWRLWLDRRLCGLALHHHCHRHRFTAAAHKFWLSLPVQQVGLERLCLWVVHPSVRRYVHPCPGRACRLLLVAFFYRTVNSVIVNRKAKAASVLSAINRLLQQTFKQSSQKSCVHHGFSHYELDAPSLNDNISVVTRAVGAWGQKRWSSPPPKKTHNWGWGCSSV